MSTNVNPAVSPDTAILEHVSALEEATNNFHYKDESVTLSVGDQVFSVSKNLLIRRSPVFQQMLSLSQDDNPAVVFLHNDPADFKAFLVYLHSEVVDVSLFDSPSHENILRLLGIATVAHMYELTSAAEWAIQKGLDLASKSPSASPAKAIPVLVKLLSTTSRWDPATAHRKRAVAMARRAASTIVQIASEEDSTQNEDGDQIAQLIVMLEAIREMEMVSWIYYNVLTYISTWYSALWLRAVDRQRLLCGHYGLTCINVNLKPPRAGSDVRQCALMADRVAQRELWPLFDPSKLAIAEVPEA